MNKATRIEIFKKASLSRNFEEIVFREIQNKRFQIPIYLSAGQEFIPASISQFFGETKPLIFGQHRNHHTYLSFGGRPDSLFKELLGFIDKDNPRMGGSASLHCPEINMFGHDGLMGSQVPIAVGACLASGRPTVCFMGDAAAEEDYVMSSIAWSSKKRLPILFVVEDNNFSILTEKSVRRDWAMHDFANSVGVKASCCCDDPSEISYVLGCFDLNKPALINIFTSRLYWHCGAGQDDYKKKDRYKLELESIGDDAKKINIETKDSLEKIWLLNSERR
jgi:TPP-dependent pyruvate/acetoin dehydrogenase alpha subunit